MFHNKIIDNKKLSDKIIWLAAPGPNYINRIYSVIISHIETAKQYDRYYILNADMLFYNYDNDVVLERMYLDMLEEKVNDVINNDKVIADIKSGNALLIFDFGSEIVPLTTDLTSMYGIINDHFHKIECTDNIVYWTMYESPYDLVDREECVIDIVPISLSTLRYIGFNYDTYREVTQNNDVPSKSAIYLNRRMRPHRTKLIMECLSRDVDLDSMYFSFMGTEETIDESGNDVAYNIDMTDVLTTKIIDTQISKSNFEKIVNGLYGKRIAMEDKDPTQWLGSSNIERVIELLNHRSKSKFEIITEYSATDTDISISEKLSLAVLSKIPFVVMGDKGYIARLHELGFQTFDNFWSEEYDNCKGDGRVIKLADTILDIQQNFKCDYDEYGNTVYSDEMNKVLEYNYIHYKDVYSQTLCNRTLSSVCRTDIIDSRCNIRDKIWYNKETESLFVPIPGNMYKCFEDLIAPIMGYELVDRSDVVNLYMLPAYVAIRSPVTRVEHQLHSTSLTLDGFIKQHRGTDHGRSQSSFIEGLNIKGIVDLDNLVSRDNPPRNILDKINDFFILDEEEVSYFSVEDITATKKAFKNDLKFYNEYKLLGEKMKSSLWQFTEHYDGTYIQNEMDIHFKTFAENYPSIMDAVEEIDMHKGSFFEKLNGHFWYHHALMIKRSGIQNAPRDIDILDMGTQLGFMPHWLKEYGFTNVDCTNSSTEASEHLYELESVWEEMGISPIDLHITPGEEFILPKQYDVILCTQTNIMWNSNKVVEFAQGSMQHGYYVIDRDNVPHTFFVPYDVEDIKALVINIKKYLKPNGMAFIQPYPFPYHLPGLTKELALLKTYQVKGHVKYPDEDQKIHDYFVITN
jgi:2-polyprenyl-3-methyl-5-hydroxy-6-metoxy-1,4-benzoquinol methylase